MKRMMTRQRLFEIDQEYNSYSREYPGLSLALEDKIKRFYERAGHELKVTATRYEAIQALYVQRNIDGTFKQEEKNGKQEWMLITDPELLRIAGVPDVSQVEDHFNAACSKLFSQTISFDL